MSTSTSLYEFGFNFLGPVCSNYMRELVKESESVNPTHILFLAREGYFFEKAFSALVENKLVEPLNSQYLLASRTFLFRICIADPESWKWSLAHKFEGTLRQLMVGRFGFSLSQLESFFSSQELDVEWSLPDQRQELETEFRKHLIIMNELVNDSKLNYLEYLSSFGLDNKSLPLLIDVGYSGTIQKLLTLLLQSNTKGLYFITTRQGNYQIGNNVAEMKCVYKDSVNMGDGYTMLDRSLLLESLLTSPDGQFIDVQKKSEHSTERFEFIYGRSANSQLHIHDLQHLFSGAIDAIIHFFKHDIVFEVKEIEMLYEQYAYKRNLFPSATWSLFDVDDAISGHGNVKPLRLFGL